MHSKVLFVVYLYNRYVIECCNKMCTCACVCDTEWLLERWVTYEQTVSELLDWVMNEAEKFASEVTTRGDKGVVDHIKSCEVSNLY